MKTIRLWKYFILALLCPFFALAQNQGMLFTNDICLPSMLYMLSGMQNDIFVEPLIKRWRPYNDVVRFSGSTEYSRRLQRVASITDPVAGSTVTLELVNQDEFKTVKTLTSTIVVGQAGVGKDTVIVSIIGDSFTNGAFFKDALLEKGYAPKTKMIGLREVVGCPGQFDEGRGGWTLKGYFSVTNQRTQAYNGFWQPEGKYRYWGATAFWNLVKEFSSDPERKWSFEEKYNASRYHSNAELFDAATGYKLNPAKNDLIYDNALESYMLYNGSKWKKTAYEDFVWDFDYGKYLSMWDLESPVILAEFLGLNDFRNALDPTSIDFSEWNVLMEKVIASYLKAVPAGRFALMIPSTSCGILDNMAGAFTTKQNACMWELRKNIIDKFDHRTDKNIHIVDGGIAIDNLYGTWFRTDPTFTLPYSGYKGDGRIAVQFGNPHPFQNYPTMGVSLAAFIQNYRKQ
ncbi:hypothetical protein HPE56_08365 [Maribacter sp. ANRC-HE7]|uniref:Uncharacterized protein n=1 Tax=Maribacter aquimaris TaxID=2737171 RepID=A0ABR7UYX7_9FLAO|nr:hypothetical protein [Maribacter aquimaris]MBD0777804.1 hypothetical protein [Maribacter aquimaris]